jgi:DNA-binding CsgD family transcriptional regulator
VAAAATSTRNAALVGRDLELATLEQFLGADGMARALVLAGGPGIGKTTLWETGIELARERGYLVLSARASDAEARFSFAALIDLLDEIDPENFDGLPAPQRNALELALLRAEPAGPPPERRAIAVGLLGLLRATAAKEQLLIAIDDAQWLDPASVDAIAYVVRRFDGGRGRFLLTKRSGLSCPLEAALGAGGMECRELRPLSVGAIRRLLSQRLGLTLPRPLLRRIVDVTLGNPLFALEIGRMLASRELPAAGDEMPVPEAIEDLLGMRVERLAEPIRKVLLAASISADLRRDEAAELVGEPAVEQAIAIGVVALDGDRLRPAHPLLGAASRQRAPEEERMELHRELANVIAAGEIHARHLALGTDEPNDALAGTIAEAAARAAARGAREEAAELAEQALRLSLPGSAGRTDRLLVLAAYLEQAGELERLSELLEPELESLPSARTRVEACVLLSEGGDIQKLADSLSYLERALVESGDDDELRAIALSKLAGNTAGIAVERLAETERWALEALPAARRAGADVERLALEALGWARALRGGAIDDICERFRAASDAPAYITASPERVAGQRHVWRGEIDAARAVLSPLLRQADERGEPVSYAVVRLHLCELELRVGAWAEAERLLDSWAETPDDELLFWPMYERCRALLAAGIGRLDEAERWAAEAVEKAEEKGVGWDRLEALRGRGIAALLGHEPERAADSLRTVWDHTVRQGVAEPGVFPAAPELVEALAELGDYDEARAVTARLRELAEEQEHPWGITTARRCAALVEAASGQWDANAEPELASAASAYGELGLAFDRARTLRSLGRAARRARKWGAARRALGAAAAAFDEIGSNGWAAESRAELERVGGRKPGAAGELTPAERRVVELAAAGASNKQIARTLFISVHTVESHLTRAYEKLGASSRSQLSARLSKL